MEPYQHFTNTTTAPEHNSQQRGDDRNTVTSSKDLQQQQHDEESNKIPFFQLPPQHYSNATTEQSPGSLPQPPRQTQTSSNPSTTTSQHQDQWPQQNSPFINYPASYFAPPFYQGAQQNVPTHHHSNYDNMYHHAPSSVGPSFPGIPHSFDSVKLEMEEVDENRPVATLENKTLWEEFHQAGTEMIITKTGRYKINPFVYIRIFGFSPNSRSNYFCFRNMHF